MKAAIKRWGNSAAIRIPASILSEVELGVNSQINVKAENGRIVIEPAEQKAQRLNLPFSEESLLQGLDANTGHADSLATLNDRELGD